MCLRRSNPHFNDVGPLVSDLYACSLLLYAGYRAGGVPAPALVLSIYVALLDDVSKLQRDPQTSGHVGGESNVFGGEVQLEARIEIALEEASGQALHRLGVTGASRYGVEQGLRRNTGLYAEREGLGQAALPH